MLQRSVCLCHTIHHTRHAAVHLPMVSSTYHLLCINILWMILKLSIQHSDSNNFAILVRTNSMKCKYVYILAKLSYRGSSLTTIINTYLNMYLTSMFIRADIIITARSNNFYQSDFLELGDVKFLMTWLLSWYMGRITSAKCIFYARPKICS